MLCGKKNTNFGILYKQLSSNSVQEMFNTDFIQHLIQPPIICVLGKIHICIFDMSVLSIHISQITSSFKIILCYSAHSSTYSASLRRRF